MEKNFLEKKKSEEEKIMKKNIEISKRIETLNKEKEKNKAELIEKQKDKSLKQKNIQERLKKVILNYK